MSSERSRTVTQTEGVVNFVAEWIENQDLSCVDTPEELAYNWREDMQRQPTPRALVALSDDRKWLVARVSSVGMFRAFGWGLFKFDGRDYIWQESVLGTGQSAEDVLRDFLTQREEQDRAAG